MFKSKSYLPFVAMKVNRINFKARELNLVGWPFIFRFPNAEIRIGRNCTINSSFFSNLIGLYQRTIIIARDKGKVNIGNNVGISGTTIYAMNEITIRDNCTIGANCKILDNDFHGIQPIDRNDRMKIKNGSVIIGENVFIGCNCIILKNTRIGNNSVIGAGSVVSGGVFPDNSIIAGNPAQIIKNLFED